jgi:hypothetical protein
VFARWNIVSGGDLRTAAALSKCATGGRPSEGAADAASLPAQAGTYTEADELRTAGLEGGDHVLDEEIAQIHDRDRRYV